MAIERISIAEVPTRSRDSVFSQEDAQEALAILKDGDVAIHTRHEKESTCRSRGVALNRLIKTLPGAKPYKVSVWKNGDGAYVGALKPKG